jgi:hypothetical protein
MKHVKLFETFVSRRHDSSLVDTNEVRNSFPYLEMARKGFTEGSPDMFDRMGKLYLYNGTVGVSISNNGRVQKAKPGYSEEFSEMTIRAQKLIPWSESQGAVFSTEDYITVLEDINKLLDSNPDALNTMRRF